MNIRKITEETIESATIEQGKFISPDSIDSKNNHIKPAEVNIIETKNKKAVHDKLKTGLVEENTNDSGLANDDSALINLNTN